MPISFKRGCSLVFAVFAISAAAIYAWLRAVTPPHDYLIPVALAAAAFLALATMSATMIFDALAERRLLREAMSGVLPQEGKWGVFIGTVHSEESVTAPLSGEKVIAYRYNIMELTSTTKGRHLFTHAKGSALCRSEVRTPFGSFPLLHAPVLADSSRNVDVATASRNWAGHAATARFEKFPDTSSLAQPAHRLDERKFENELDWSSAQWIEESLSDGEEVTIYGSFSGRGIGADPSSGAPPCIYRPGETSMKVAERLKQGISGVAVSLVFAIAIIAGYWFFATRQSESTKDRLSATSLVARTHSSGR